jgi:hypothetical protein
MNLKVTYIGNGNIIRIKILDNMEQNKKQRWSNALRAKYRKEGADACEAGQPISNNPYELDSSEYILWNDGHYNAGEGHQLFMRQQWILDELI